MTLKTPFSENTISVSEINATIKSCMDSPIFRSLDVFGEISGFKFSGPHAYFTLKDKYSQISCVCFYAAKTYTPKDGESVIVRGSVDYYVKGGRLSLQADSITPVGQGLLFLEFERLKAKLSAEGLFDETHKKELPAYAKNILVVTSKTGAVIRDIVTTVRRKNPVTNIVVRDARVQGENAGHEIAGILKLVDTLGYDVIIIARGGGSLEDLAPFYSEELVRVIYAMQTPIVSAVGHETDFSLADFVADMRAPTPTAAGELVAYDYYALKEKLYDLSVRLKRSALRTYEHKSMQVRLQSGKLQHLANSFYTERVNRVLSCVGFAKNKVERRLDAAAYKVGVSTTAAETAITKKIAYADFRLHSAVDSLDKLSPLKTLKRGYFRLSSETGSALTYVKNVKPGDNISASGGDGVVYSTVTRVELYLENDD